MSAIYSEAGSVYGCDGARRTRLGAGPALSHPARVARWALAGRYAAVDLAQMGVDTFSSTVRLVDLASGATVGSAPATTPAKRAESFVSVTALRASAVGAAAWIGRRSAIGTPQPWYELHVLRADGRDLLLSSGTVPLSGLRTARTRVSWLEGPRRVTEPLPA